jgi:hypothetical protein
MDFEETVRFLERSAQSMKAGMEEFKKRISVGNFFASAETNSQCGVLGSNGADMQHKENVK